jgi:hypothetical protein
MMEAMIYVTTLALDPIAAMLIIIILLRNNHFDISTTWYRIGLSLCAAGLAAQGYRSFIAATTGEFPPEGIVPWWVFKDWGLIVLVSYYAYQNFVKKGE